MLLHVLGESALTSEGHAAAQAEVRLATCVAMLMNIQELPLGKRLGAVATLVGPLFSVDTTVLLQAPCFNKALVTMRALVRPRVDVDKAGICDRSAWLCPDTRRVFRRI